MDLATDSGSEYDKGKKNRVPNDSPIEYNCKISRQKTALTDTLKHTQAVSSADRVQFTGTYS